MTYETEQERFWSGDFGEGYRERNRSEALLMSKIALWNRILASAHGVASICELGCNIGLNLAALHRIAPKTALSAVEINAEAAAQARALNVAEVTTGTILAPLDLPPVDLAFTCGVLIHISPDHLAKAYENLVRLSRRYVVVAEYYNPSPVSVPYRGHADRLFKRDFAGELMDGYGLKLVDYGFVWRRDNWAPQDDVTWFLLEK
ncbi:pseudaminic acid biosynthesis-associated methylase [Jiella sp. M17.18]|uniref:pseudaminic acid biosynthesis-associated methylase n=1 Tax=Jiella sp. M17.18 TaxID=3234247 RepID=UPI0034DF241E